MPLKRGQLDAAATSEDGVIYARYSSHSQREESIEQQIEECMAFARQNNIRIVHIYADKAVSGKTERRTNFQRLMRDAEKKKFRVVIAYKSNRIARNMLNALQYEAKLDLLGIRTLYAKEEFGNTAAGRFALRTMMNVNQFYSENMAEDIRRGLMDNAEKCKVNGRLPYGYRKGPDGKYAVEPKEAEIVRDIYARYLSGEKIADIASFLNACGLLTSYGKKWGKNSFHKLLTNDNYIGVYRYSGVVIEGGVPAIIDPDVFWAVQRKLEEEKSLKGIRKDNADYILTGKLICGKCGSYMVGVSGTSKSGALHYYYYCNNHRTGGGCDMRNVRRDWIEYQVALLTQRHVFHDEIIEWIADQAVEIQLQEAGNSELPGMEAARAEKKKAISNIMAAIEQGIITETTKDRLVELEGEVKALDARIAAAKAVQAPVDRNRIVFTLNWLREGNPTDKEYQRRLIDTFVKAVYLNEKEIKIDYYYAGGDNSRTVPLSDLGPVPGGDGGPEESECSSKVPSAPPKILHTNTLCSYEESSTPPLKYYTKPFYYVGGFAETVWLCNIV